ncbi:MAG: DNA topoisomerase I [Candidatus Nitrosocosmicus sp.]
MSARGDIVALQEPFALVICEKPAAAQKIAQALGSSGLKKISTHEMGDNKTTTTGVPSPFFYATDKKGQHFVICYALGHLYGLVDAGGNRRLYPVFDIKWRPLSKKNSGTNFNALSEKIERIIKTISTLSKKASIFIHACDYDQEGEVIGYNILEYACNKKYEKSLRAKFSTLTDDEIRNSFDNLSKPITRLADAGKSRHMIDFIYGVNLSRALTQSLRDSNGGKIYHNLTIGRVQGPTLAFVVDKELEIRSHVSVPYWTIAGKFEKDGYIIDAYYYPQKLDSLSKATVVVDACKNQDGVISEIKVQKIVLRPPYPFNIGDLQREAYRIFKFSPSYTLSIAEKLYLSAMISYPRTSSQKLPSSINYIKIISDLSRINFPSNFTGNSNGNGGNNNSYGDMAKRLLSKEHLSANEGSKSDPAHPAIYPTGQKPKGKLEDGEIKLFDLIAKRFFATFGDPSITQQTIITILVKGSYIFKAEGKTMLYEGWMYFYKPYANTSNFEMPYILSMLQKWDTLKNVDVILIEKQTQPPTRFNPSSLLEKMEKERIGTKATRSEIINTLFKRDYITNAVVPPKEKETNDLVLSTGIKPTDLGFEVIQSMRKYIPNIVSVDLTRSMEEQLDKIESGEIKSDLVLDHSKNKLKEAMVILKEHQKEIGTQITSAVKTTNAVVTAKNKPPVTLGACPSCKRGNLIVKKSNKTKKRFAGCSLYSSDSCSAIAPLPQKGTIKRTGKTCSMCRWPIIQSKYSHHEKYPWQFCINMHCPSKTDNKNNLKDALSKPC